MILTATLPRRGRGRCWKSSNSLGSIPGWRRRNAEQMYLEKLAYIRKDRQSAGLQTAAEIPRRPQRHHHRAVQALRGYWQSELGVPGHHPAFGYNPLGEYQAGFLDRDAKGGYRHQFRVWISPG